MRRPSLPRSPRPVRIGAAAVGVVVALAALTVVLYRVFAPHETLTRPTVAYPEQELITDERPFSELRAAPLVVEGRLRVYAEKWRVWSDAPVGGRYEATPYWAYRRWPAQVVGVVTATTPGGPVVVSRWSDGEIVALDARRGEVAWRMLGPDPERRYEGRRTGATTVYEPETLLTASNGAGAVIIVTGPTTVHGFNAATGAKLWDRALPAGCRPAAWTGSTVLALPDCDGSSVAFVGAASGRDLGWWTPPVAGARAATAAPAPALCAIGRSDCQFVTVNEEAWRLADDGTLTSVPALERGARLAGDRIVYPTADGIAARRLTESTPLWSWRGKGTLVAADAAGAYLLTDDLIVLGLSPVTGRLSVVGCATSIPDEHWRLGHVYPTGGGYLALERLSKNGSPADGDQQYFYGPRPMALVELYPPTKLPVWPGKFAACSPPV